MAIDWGETPPRRLPVYLLIGTSASMRGELIAAINNSITATYQMLMGNPRSAQTVHISLITFSDQAYQMPMVPIAQFVPPQLSASGRGVSLGAALRLLNESLDRDFILNVPALRRKGDYSPVVFLLMGATPTDEWRAQASLLKSRVQVRLNIIGLTIGDDVDQAVMRAVCTEVMSISDLTSEKMRYLALHALHDDTIVLNPRIAAEPPLEYSKVALSPLPPGIIVDDVVSASDTAVSDRSSIPASAPSQPPSRTPPTRVFVSHSHADDAFTARLVTDLRAAGIDVWVDVVDMEPGDFLARISEALARCDWLVLVLTPNAISSSFVNLEVNTAIGRVMKQHMRGVIPILAAPTDPQIIPPIWDSLHRYDATRDYQQALQELLRALSRPGH